ncbi:unnamed protein product [Linum tenue]|uniref:Arp2/3 complex 34 kDa subunit n=1 Tax=Linum tenue TaxID=586396 RepID=A0AAV0LTS6_9ROSI|nr:unnamed protein product [Linum tenue]
MNLWWCGAMKGKSSNMPCCFERESPALKQILLKLYHAEKPVEIDHHLYEFGSVEYYVQSSAADPHHSFLSVLTPLLSQGEIPSNGPLSPYTIQMVKDICSESAEVVEPAREGYQLTLKLNFSMIPKSKESEKVVRRIASVQAVIISSQLKEIFRGVDSHGTFQPIKLVYYPREPFYLIRQPQKITAVFPMRFKEHSDVVIATAFFQELMDVGSSAKWAKTPTCTWAPIPPPELRGESIEDLSTNGGFVSFDICSRHVEGKKLEKTVWTLLNFYAFVKNHIKCTRGLIQRRMQKRLESLVEVLHKGAMEEDNKVKRRRGGRYIRKLVSLSKFKTLKRRCSDIVNKIKRLRYRIKIHGFNRFRRRWLTLPKFSSSRGYSRLE